MKEITQSDIQLMYRVMRYIAPSHMMNAVYISPAQQLRNAADELEQKEKDVRALEELTQKLIALNPRP